MAELSNLSSLRQIGTSESGGSDLCHSNGFCRPFGAWLSRGSQLLYERMAVTDVENTKRISVLDKALFISLLKHTADIDSIQPMTAGLATVFSRAL